MTSTIGNHETRLIDRRCRCGKLLAESSKGCIWHPTGSTRYAADLLIYIATLKRTPRRPPWSRLAAILRELFDTQGKVMNVYLFEYLDDNAIEREHIRAVDSKDAFNAFRASHPAAPISNIWVELFSTK